MMQPLKTTATVVYVSPQRLKVEQGMRDDSQSRVQPSAPKTATALAKAWRVKAK